MRYEQTKRVLNIVIREADSGGRQISAIFWLSEIIRFQSLNIQLICACIRLYNRYLVRTLMAFNSSKFLCTCAQTQKVFRNSWQKTNCQKKKTFLTDFGLKKRKGKFAALALL